MTLASSLSGEFMTNCHIKAEISGEELVSNFHFMKSTGTDETKTHMQPWKPNMTTWQNCMKNYTYGGSNKSNQSELTHNRNIKSQSSDHQR